MNKMRYQLKLRFLPSLNIEEFIILNLSSENYHTRSLVCRSYREVHKCLKDGLTDVQLSSSTSSFRRWETIFEFNNIEEFENKFMEYLI